MLKKIFKVLILLTVFCFGLILYANYIIENSTKDKIYNSIENLPTTGLVGVQFETAKWGEIEAQKVRDSFFDFPKNI